MSNRGRRAAARRDGPRGRVIRIGTLHNHCPKCNEGKEYARVLYGCRSCVICGSRLQNALDYAEQVKARLASLAVQG